MRRSIHGRAALVLVSLLAAALWLGGMSGGNGGGNGAADIPIPDENYNVAIADTSGQQLNARRFTWEGKVHFRGQLGNATVTLPFAKVRSVRVLHAQVSEDAGNLVPTEVELRNGNTVRIAIDRSSKCYGETEFGSYEIFFKDVGRIAFQG